jgi:two-component system cell cycle sensor histidine kinase/response regulator CckA
MRAATVFIVAGYGGKERGLMKLLIEGAKRFPDTQIFWIAHERHEGDLSEYCVELLETSKYSRAIFDQDSDQFFYELLQEMGIGAPKIIEDPLFALGNLKDGIAYSSSPEIDAILANHHQKVEQIQSVFDPLAIGRQRDLTRGSSVEDAKFQAVERLAAGMANDFNNVLTSTIGYSDLLAARHPVGDPSHDEVVAIRQSADRAALLVNKLLAFASSLTLSPQRVDLNKLIIDLSAPISKFVPAYVQVRYDLSPQLGAVFVDIDQFEDAVVSIVTNAAESITSGPGFICIRTLNLPEGAPPLNRVTRVGASVLMEIEDSGCGVEPGLGDRIFDPYFSTKGTGRSGMGLSAVLGLVRQSGGVIDYESRLGKGTTFRIYLPKHVTVSRRLETAVSGSAAKLTIPKPSSGALTALYVEDEPSVREFTVRILQELGFIVLQASGGMEAINIYRTLESNLSLVISDMVMPHGDGPTVLKELRFRGYRGPFIMSSGYAEEDVRGALVDDMETLFLPKPYSVNQLAEAVNKAINRSEFKQ